MERDEDRRLKVTKLVPRQRNGLVKRPIAERTGRRCVFNDSRKFPDSRGEPRRVCSLDSTSPGRRLTRKERELRTERRKEAAKGG